MYETTSFAGSPSDRLYLSVTRRTREERQALFDSYEVSPPPLVFHTPGSISLLASTLAVLLFGLPFLSTLVSYAFYAILSFSFYS